MDWEALLKYLGGVTGIAAALIFIGRKAIDAFMQTRVEKYRANLERITLEHSVRFQRLHSERAEVIKTLYQKLVELDNQLHSCLRYFQAAGEEPLVTKVNKLGDSFNDFYRYFQPNQIFFEEGTCQVIERFANGAKGVFIDITVLPVEIDHIQYRYDRAALNERHDFWRTARNTYETDIATLKRDLEGKFREVLGIDVQQLAH